MNSTEIYRKSNELFSFKIPLDGLLTAIMKKPTIDLLAFDKKLAQKHSDYKPNECTYRGKKGYSMSMVIKKIYGKEANEFIDLLM